MHNAGRAQQIELRTFLKRLKTVLWLNLNAIKQSRNLYQQRQAAEQ
jgi:hypothetical protein